MKSKYKKREIVRQLTARGMKIVGGVVLIASVLMVTYASGQVSDKSVQQGDLVYICNEDSNTLSVIDPVTNTVKATINLTSFDEDPRPPFRFVTGGVIPTHAGMVTKPLYHGAISIHGAVPSPDQTMIATTGRGTSNVYLIDTRKMSVIGNRPNPQATSTTNDQILSSGILVGREPHEPTFTPNGKELWVTLRGENRIAVLDLEKAKRESSGIEGGSIRTYVPTVLGPAQVWFSKDGALAFVISQKTSTVEVFRTNFDDEGFSHPTSDRTLDISGQDPYAFTPFLKLTPDGKEIWFSHKLADALSSRAVEGNQALLDNIPLGKNARPNHIEFVENRNGKVVYATLARVDDGGPDSVASSRVLIIDRSGAVGTRAVVGNFFSHGREAHGIWTNPANDRLYIAHEQDQLPGTPNEGQTVCSVFDVTEPLSPKFITQIPLGEMDLPSGKLRNKKSINLVYVRPGKTL